MIQNDLFDTQEDIYLKEIEHLDQEIKRLTMLRSSLRKRLIQTCPHDHIIVKREFIEGGYDYVSTCDIVCTCTKCGEEIERTPDPNHTPRYG